MDKIIISDLKIFAYHGVNDEEKQNGQNFVLDITLYVDLARPCVTDDVKDTVSYSSVLKTVKKAFCSEKFDLIERASKAVADAILMEYERVHTVDVTVKKPEAPINASFGFVAVNIVRSR